MVLVTRGVRSPRLAGWVEALWHFEGSFGHALERLLPTASPQLLINIGFDRLSMVSGGHAIASGGAALCGPLSRPAQLETIQQRAVVGVTFAPGGASRFLSPPMSELCDRHTDAGDLWGRAGAVLRERVLEAPTPAARLDVCEAFLLEQLRGAADAHGPITRVLADLAAGVPVAAVGAAVGLSPRRLIVLLREQVGFTPKHHARVVRFRRVVAAAARAPRPDWAGLAVDHGYFDQAHLVREWRVLGGSTPTAYRPRAPDQPGHALLST